MEFVRLRLCSKIAKKPSRVTAYKTTAKITTGILAYTARQIFLTH